jgi:hypothetical protein
VRAHRRARGLAVPTLLPPEGALKALSKAGLVTDRRGGRWSCYALDAETFDQLEEFVGGLPSTRLSVLASRCRG